MLTNLLQVSSQIAKCLLLVHLYTSSNLKDANTVCHILWSDASMHQQLAETFNSYSTCYAKVVSTIQQSSISHIDPSTGSEFLI